MLASGVARPLGSVWHAAETCSVRPVPRRSEWQLSVHRRAPFAGMILGLVGLAGLSHSAAAQAPALRVQVLSASGLPLGGAVVRIAQTGQTARTDATGWFRWPGAETGRWDLAVSAIGIRPAVFAIEVINGTLTPQSVRLEPVVQQLDSLTVRTVAPPTARLAEFERRRLAGFGRYSSGYPWRSGIGGRSSCRRMASSMSCRASFERRSMARSSLGAPRWT